MPRKDRVFFSLNFDEIEKARQDGTVVEMLIAAPAGTTSGSASTPYGLRIMQFDVVNVISATFRGEFLNPPTGYENGCEGDLILSAGGGSSQGEIDPI